MKTVREALGQDVYTTVWERSDDVTESIHSLDELYPNVPEHLKNKKVYTMMIEVYDDKDIDEWKNNG